jgi:hypothetical protein
MTLWVWLSLVLLLCLAGCVLYQWFFVIQQSAYQIDYFAPLSAARQRAHLARLGIGILLPLALVTYFRKPSAMSLSVRVLYLGAVGLAAAVLVIYWTTKFRNW